MTDHDRESAFVDNLFDSIARDEADRIAARLRLIASRIDSGAQPANWGMWWAAALYADRERFAADRGSADRANRNAVRIRGAPG